MARRLNDIAVRPGAVLIRAQFPTANFTIALNAPIGRVRVQGTDLKQVNSRRNFRSGAFLVEGQRTFMAFDLPVGETIVSVVA